MSKKSQIAKIICLTLLCFGSSLTAADYSQKVGSNSQGSMPALEAAAQESKKADVSIDMDKLSRAFGNFIGRNLQTSPGMKFNIENLIEGIKEGAAGKPSPLSEKEYEAMMAAAQEKAFKEMADKNLKAANEFISKNSKESNVKEIVPEKLQYLILKEGNGPEVTAHASPKILYSGKYQNGTVFGSSEETGGPITIPLGQTIPGFSKGLVGMKEGEKRRLFVHPDLGYGTMGQLPPNELLIFDIEVVKADTADEKDKKENSDKDQSSESSDEEDFFFEEDDVEETAPTAK